MGSNIEAICECGYNSPNIFAGGGLSNFLTSCKVPAMCFECNDLVVVNCLEAATSCPKCGGQVILYDDPALRKESSKSAKGKTEIEPIFDWNLANKRKRFCLPNAQYYCPKCTRMTLKFANIGDWD